MGSIGEQPVTREDLETELRQTLGRVGDTVDSRKRGIVATVVLVGGALLVATYFIGRQIGRVKSTVVEVRRI